MVSTRLCQFYSSLRPAAVKRVQAVGGPRSTMVASDAAGTSATYGRRFDSVVAGSRRHRSLVDPARNSCLAPSAVAATIDDVVKRTNGWTSVMARNQSLAIERGLAPTHRVICELGAGVVGVISTYTLDQLTTARCQLGFWIGPSGRGKGYGTEAVTAFVEHLHTSGTTVIEASTAHTNEPCAARSRQGRIHARRWSCSHPSQRRDDRQCRLCARVSHSGENENGTAPLEQSVQAFGPRRSESIGHEPDVSAERTR